MKVLILDKIHPSLQLKLSVAGITCLKMEDEKALTEQHVSAYLSHHGCIGLILRSGITVGKRLIAQNPQLKFIGRVGAGVEHIDVACATSSGIQVLSSPEGNRQSVAEHALGMLLAMLHRLPKADQEVKRGIWNRNGNEGDELSGKTIGIVGHGNTGSAFGHLLAGFRVRVLAYDKYKTGHGTSTVTAATMEEIYNSADVVSIHLPLTDETQALLNDEWFARFAKPIDLINTSRGGILRTDSLLRALDQNQVRYACLDVLEYESDSLQMPSIKDLPETAHMLFKHPRVLLSPHSAGLSRQSFEKLAAVLADKVIDFLKRA
jgi:D-3-phosphoglycerate dehydrogenase